MPRRPVLAVLAAVAFVAACGSPEKDLSAPTSDLTERVRLVDIADLPAPIAFTTRPGDPDNVAYVATQSGSVIRLDTVTGQADEVASFAERTKAEGERGLLGLAFSPTGDEMYAHYTDLEGDTNVVAVPVTSGIPDTERARRLLFVEQPYSNHNGGQLLVDASGALLIGLGDGGSSGDPQGYAQNRTSLLGKILRISPSPASEPRPYTIPADNPFAGSSTTAPEILFLGLRNPWRFSIDAATGDFWIADVGQNKTEEISRIPGVDSGANLGWDVKEGSAPFEGSTAEQLTDPIHEWANVGGSSAIGGFVYRGSAIDELRGRYVFADFAQRGLLVLDPATGVVTRLELPVESIVAFGEDRSGELYVLSLRSGVQALRPVG